GLEQLLAGAGVEPPQRFSVQGKARIVRVEGQALLEDAWRLVLERQLPFYHRGQPGRALARHDQGQLLGEQAFVHAALVVVEQALARHRVAHGLEHHLQEQTLELLCGGAQSLRIVTLDLGLEGGQGIDVEDGRDRRGGAHDGSEHADRLRSAIGRENRQKLPSSDKAAQITSSSPRRAPEAFIAWRMAIRSCGLAPSAFSALTISARLALLRMFCMALSSWLISIWVLVTGAGWPP